MFTRRFSKVARVFKRPPTDTKYIIRMRNGEYKIDNDKWYPQQLQSYEEWPEELKDKINKPINKPNN